MEPESEFDNLSHHSQRRREAPAPKASSSPHQQLNLKEMVFHNHEPWERSLQRELDRMDRVAHRRPPTDKVLLGHSESGDYALAVDADECSVNTNTSLTVPTKIQFVHRPVQRAALFQAEEEAAPGSPTCVRDYAVTTEALLLPEARDDRHHKPSPPGKSFSKRRGEDWLQTEQDVPDAACFCFGPESLLDNWLLPPRRRTTHKRLDRVLEMPEEPVLA